MATLIPILDGVISLDRVGLPARSVQDQGDLDACFSCAIATAMEARSAQVPPLSPAYHFHYAAGGQAVIGLSDITAFSVLTRYGISSFKSHFPDYAGIERQITLNQIQSAPPRGAESDGAKRRLDVTYRAINLGYVEISSPFLSDMKDVLRDGAALVAIFYPNQAYWQMSHTRFPNLPRISKLENTDPPFDGAHAVSILGFSEEKSCFIVQDSHGKDFGENGQWLLPFDFANSGLIYRVFGLYSSSV